MFCRNCGKEIDNAAAVCVHCGVPTGKGTNFCNNCGEPTATEAVICPKCGTSLVPPKQEKGSKSKLVAGLLAIFLGTYGVHNFYLGNTGKAIAQLLITLLTCFVGSIVTSVWALIEGVMLLCGKIETDGYGNKLSD